MQTDPLWFFRMVATLGFLGTSLAGILSLRHREQLFGIDADIPSENASARSYSRLLFAAVFAHALLFFAAGMLFL